MKESILELSNLDIGFNKSVFSHINGKLMTGSLTALMGVNGVGKSCFLKTIGNLIPSLSGDILLQGKELKTYKPIEFAKIVSLVLTEKFQVDFLKVEELIFLGRSPYTNWMGNFNQSDRAIVDQVIAQVGIDHLRNCFFAELSDGQKQKVLIARALAQTPKLLILDEPTTYLDIPSKVELINLLKKIALENQVAIIMSTHDLDLIESKVDQVWLMGKNGQFHQESPAVCRASGLFEKHFFLG